MGGGGWRGGHVSSSECVVVKGNVIIDPVSFPLVSIPPRTERAARGDESV